MQRNIVNEAVKKPKKRRQQRFWKRNNRMHQLQVKGQKKEIRNIKYKNNKLETEGTEIIETWKNTIKTNLSIYLYQSTFMCD